MDSSTRAWVADALLRVWKDSRDKTSRFEETIKGPHKFFFEAGKQAIVLGPVGIAAFHRLVTLLGKDPVIGKIFSRKELERRIRSAASNLYAIDRQKIETCVNSYVDEMLRRLETAIPLTGMSTYLWRICWYVPNFSSDRLQ